MTADPSSLVDFYLRLSVDREGKDSLERQEADLREWAKSEGLTVRKVWRDKGKSGYKAGVIRPDFEHAVQAIKGREVGTLAVWKLDRLSRRGAGQVGLVLDEVEAVGGRVYFLRDGLDSRDSSHRMLIILVSEQARAESANTKLRVRAKIAADAAKGMPKGGLRPFGWEPDGVTLRPQEADLLRTAVDDYLHGRRSMLRIAKDWNAAGIKTDGMKRERAGRDGVKRPARGLWTATTVRQMFLRERNAGLLLHNGVIMPESRIAAIITEDEREALLARVKTGTPLSERAETLLGGVLRCECGAAMHGTVSYSQRKGGPRHVYQHYKCSASLYDKSRRHASIVQSIADEMFTVLAISDLFKQLIAPPAATDNSAALQGVTARLVANGEALAHTDGILLDVTLKRLHAKARGQAKVLEAERTELEAERDRLLAQAAESGGLNAVLDEMRSGFKDTQDGLEGWTARLSEEWNRVGIDVKQSWLRARYRPVVRVGGRGIERITPNPIEAVA